MRKLITLLVSLCALCERSNAAISWVSTFGPDYCQGCSGTAQQWSSGTFTTPSLPANSELILGVRTSQINGGTGTTTVSSPGVTWTRDGNQLNPSGMVLEVWHGNITNSGTKTITVTIDGGGTSSSIRINGVVYSGVNFASPTFGFSSTAGHTGTPNAGSIVASSSGVVLVNFSCTDSDLGHWVVQDGYTQRTGGDGSHWVNDWLMTGGPTDGPGGTCLTCQEPFEKLSPADKTVNVGTYQGDAFTFTADWANSAVIGLNPSSGGTGGTNPPSITSQPTGQTNYVGDTSLLSLVATGDGTLTYQWRKNTNAITGATSASYSIANSQLTDQGWYDCIVTNTFGKLTSSIVYLSLSYHQDPVFAGCWTNAGQAFTTLTVSGVTVSGPNPVLVAGFNSYDSPTGTKVGSVNRGAQSFTKIGSVPYYSANGSLEIWALANPTPGNASVAINSTGATIGEGIAFVQLYTNAIGLFEVVSSASTLNPSVTTSDTLNAASSVNDRIVDFLVVANSQWTPGASQSLAGQYLQAATATRLHSSHRGPTAAGTTAMSWSGPSDQMSHIAVGIKPFANAAPATVLIFGGGSVVSGSGTISGGSFSQ